MLNFNLTRNSLIIKTIVNCWSQREIKPRKKRYKIRTRHKSSSQVVITAKTIIILTHASRLSPHLFSLSLPTFLANQFLGLNLLHQWCSVPCIRITNCDSYSVSIPIVSNWHLLAPKKSTVYNLYWRIILFSLKV